MGNHQTHVQLIWDIAELLRGPYKPHEYGRVVLPFTVLRRLDCVLAADRHRQMGRWRRGFNRDRGCHIRPVGLRRSSC
jgi:type I restriction enzyme M protein